MSSSKNFVKFRLMTWLEIKSNRTWLDFMLPPMVLIRVGVCAGVLVLCSCFSFVCVCVWVCWWCSLFRLSVVRFLRVFVSRGGLAFSACSAVRLCVSSFGLAVACSSRLFALGFVCVFRCFRCFPLLVRGFAQKFVAAATLNLTVPSSKFRL